MTHTDEDILYKVLAIYSLLLVILGTLGNLFTCFVCCCKRLRKVTTFNFIAFMSITEILTLYVWNLDHFLLPFFGFEIEPLNIHACRFSVFLQFFSLQYSIWILVSLKKYFL